MPVPHVDCIEPIQIGGVVCLQKYERGKGLAFHFDKDEHAMRKTGSMQHPQLSSIVYLTGERTQPRQGKIYTSCNDSSQYSCPSSACLSFRTILKSEIVVRLPVLIHTTDLVQNISNPMHAC
jgi:hypothetical protein